MPLLPGLPMPSDTSTTPTVGRVAASEQLAAWHLQMHAGQRHLVLVGGEAGIGKSTLIRRLIDSASARGDAFAVGQCVDQAAGGEPYLPILDALADLANGADGAHWIAALRQAAPTWLAQLPWLAPDASPGRPASEPAGASQERMLREFGALLDIATPARPLLLVLEDLHWSDHATVSLLGFFARRRGPARWMVVGSYRPIDLALDEHPLQALRQELRLHKLCHEIVLEPFSEQEVDEYLRLRLHGRALTAHEALARALHAHTEGLPLFLANVVDDVEDLQPLGDAGALWSDPVAALARLRLPETVVGIVERQIGRLPGDLRELLEAASVLGVEFNHTVLATLLGTPGDLLRDRCDGLARRAEWLRSAGLAALPDGRIVARYAFRHALYRRVFHERAATARKLDWHRQAAAVLIDLWGPLADRNAAEIAQHFEAARAIGSSAGVALDEVACPAVSWRLRAARAAVAVHAPVDALTHFAQALSADISPDQRVRVLCECAALHQQLSHGDEALDCAAAALDAARVLGDSALAQAAMLRRASILQKNDHPHEAILLVDELLASSPPPPMDLRADALLAKAEALGDLGRLTEADAAALGALNCLAPDDHAARARHHDGRITAHYQRGEFVEGLAVIELARTLYERIGDAAGAATMMSRRGVFELKLGRAAAAEATLHEALALLRGLNDVPGQRGVLLNLIKLRSDIGDVDGTLALLNTGWQLAAGFESPVTQCAFLNGFYYCNYLRGDLGAALHDAARVLEIADTLDSVFWRVGSNLLVADLYIHLGERVHAAALVDAALAWTVAADLQHMRPRAISHRAWLDVLDGQAAQALATVDAMLGSGEAIDAEARASLALVRALAQIALGAPLNTLSTLEPFDTAPTQEVWARMLALRLQAQCEVGAIALADLKRAELELADRLLPALESVMLRRQLAVALRAHGSADAAALHDSHLTAQCERLAFTLRDAPPTMADAVRALGARAMAAATTTAP